MKLRTKLMMFTAATALMANVAYAAIDAQALADSYLAKGYTFVEVKTGPTQTKVEAIKGETEIEVVYLNETGKILSTETQAADDDEIGREGVEIDTSDEDFDDVNDEDDDEDDDEDEDDNHGHGNDDDHDDADNPGQGGGGHGSDDDDDDDEDDEDDEDEDDEDDESDDDE